MPRGKDLRSFKPGRDGRRNADDGFTEQAKQAGINDGQMDQAKRLKDQINQYQGKSEESLLQELLQVSKDQKQKGGLDEHAMRKFKDTVWPMLNEEQRKKFKSIMEMIDRQ